MTTTVGYVTPCTKKPKKGKGLWDEIWEIENYQDSVEHLVINPQDIFFEDGEFRYKERKKKDYYPLDDSDGFKRRKWLPASEKGDVNFFDKFSDVDHLRIRGFRPKGSDIDVFVAKKALSEIEEDHERFMTNTLDSIEYCNDKALTTIDISRWDEEIMDKKVSDVVPTTRIFNLKNPGPEEKSDVKDYVRRRLQGAHKSQVLKPCDDRGGNGIMPIYTGSKYKSYIDNYERKDFLVQDMFEAPSLRVQMVGPGNSEEDIYGSYVREVEEGDIRAQNSKSKEHIDLDDFQKDVSLLIHKKSGARVSAIDYLVDNETGDLAFLEINGENPGWKNLKKVYDCDDFLPPGADDGFVDKMQETGLASYIVEDMVCR